MSLGSVSDAGAYEEAGVVIVGFRFADGRPVEHILLQIAGPDFDGAANDPEDHGIHIEINDQIFGRYGAVSEFVFDRAGNAVCFRLDHPDFPDLRDIGIGIPATMRPREISLIKKMARLAGARA